MDAWSGGVSAVNSGGRPAWTEVAGTSGLRPRGVCGPRRSSPYLSQRFQFLLWTVRRIDRFRRRQTSLPVGSVSSRRAKRSSVRLKVLPQHLRSCFFNNSNRVPAKFWISFGGHDQRPAPMSESYVWHTQNIRLSYARNPGEWDHLYRCGPTALFQQKDPPGRSSFSRLSVRSSLVAVSAGSRPGTMGSQKRMMICPGFLT